MIMLNIGVFIVWGFIVVIFIDNGWLFNKDLVILVGLMIIYLILLLIVFSGGCLIYDLCGGIIVVIVIMGVIVVLFDILMLFGVMIMGLFVGWLMKKID